MGRCGGAAVGHLSVSPVGCLVTSARDVQRDVAPPPGVIRLSVRAHRLAVRPCDVTAIGSA